MRSPALLLLAATACALACATSQPSPRPASDETLVAELVDIAGLDALLGQIGPSIEKQFARAASASGRDAAWQQRSTEHLRESFATAGLQASLRQHLVAHVERARLEDALRWLRSPTGMRVINAEKAANGDGVAADKEAWLAQAKTQPPSPERVTLLQKIDESAEVTELVLDSVVAVMRPWMLAAAIETGGLSPEAYAQVDAQIAQVRTAARPRTAPGVFQHLLYAYRGLSDEELAGYLAFSQGPTGRWYHGSVRAALAHAMQTGGTRFAQAMMAP